MARHPLYVVDAFGSRPFTGNPAAVCLLRRSLPDETLQAVAAEMNLSETAFVRSPDDDLFAATRFDLRWFTPTIEVDLCGHATLAAAKVLYDELGTATNPLPFDTRSGPLLARPKDRLIEIELPSAVPVSVAPPSGLAGVLGTEEVGTTLAHQSTLVVRYESERTVRALRPDFRRLASELSTYPFVVATAPGAAPVDLVSRCFAPMVGIDEDPVTGAAHAVLGPYWAAVLGKTHLRAHQASRRGGDLELEIRSDGRIGLAGRSRIVLRGYLDLPGS